MLLFIKKWYFIPSIVFVISACTDFIPPPPFEEEPPEEPIYDCTIHVSDSNPVVDITEVSDSLIFHLENNQKMVRMTSCYSEYSVDSSQWRVLLVHEDSTEQYLPFLGNSFDIHPDSIRVDIYERAPLTALVSFTLPFPRKVMVRIHGRTENSPDLTHVFSDLKSSYTIPVYGLYADFNNRVTVSVLDRDGHERISNSFSIQTGKTGTIESGLMNVFTNNYRDTAELKFFLVQNTIYDSEGNIRWYSVYRGNKYYPLHDRSIAIQLLNDKGTPAVKEEDIRVVSLLGEELALYDVPNRNHHEIIEKSPGGNLLVATNAEPYLSTADDTEDAIVEIDRQTGEVVKFWDLRDIFDQTRPRIWTEMPNDWCHLNSIQYDSTDHTLLISSKLQYFVSKIDYETGAIRWIFGNHENWKEPWQEYLLTPLNFDTQVHPDRDWVYAQHMPRLTKEGNIIVYDNGRKRPGGDFTRVHEFSVDTAGMTTETVWTHDFEYSTRTMGSVQERENGNVLIGHGENGRLIEVNRQGEVIFEAKLQTYYRAYPFKLY